MMIVSLFPLLRECRVCATVLEVPPFVVGITASSGVSADISSCFSCPVPEVRPPCEYEPHLPGLPPIRFSSTVRRARRIPVGKKNLSPCGVRGGGPGQGLWWV